MHLRSLSPTGDSHPTTWLSKSYSVFLKASHTDHDTSVQPTHPYTAIQPAHPQTSSALGRPDPIQKDPRYRPLTAEQPKVPKIWTYSKTILR
ncbi:hypothetical protein TSMEX_006747 [Taenia solium]|eukprot:TsM_000637500 transcript=TsM_000637500 gene=TsM_000637500